VPNISALVRRFLVPLAERGQVRPLRLLGTDGALGLAQAASLLDVEAEQRLDAARLRNARQLAPVDGLPDLGEGEWLLAAALNDLLLAADPARKTLFRIGARPDVLGSVLSTVEQVEPPRTVAEALSRHAVFCHLPDLVRLDTHVRFWAGSRTYAGRTPPRRLLYWARLRRVSTEHERVRLCLFAGHRVSFSALWLAGLERWLAASPLTDLSSMHRSAPAFRFTAGNLALVATPAGRAVALRALCVQGELHAAVCAGEQALTLLPPRLVRARPWAERFLEEARELKQAEAVVGA
jgi:hypothetical protein